MTIFICAYCGRDISKRGSRRTNHEGQPVCRRSCSWHPYRVDETLLEANDQEREKG